MLEIFMERVVGEEGGGGREVVAEGGGEGARRMFEVGTKLKERITGELKARKWT